MTGRISRDSGVHGSGYMPWFFQDYRTDQRVKLLTSPEDHVYRLLLEEQWAEGSVPNDPEMLFRLVWRTGTPGNMEPVYREAVRRVAELFFVTDSEDSSKLVNPRLCEIVLHARERNLGNFMRGHALTEARLRKRGQGAAEPSANGAEPAPGTQIARHTSAALTVEQITTGLAPWVELQADATQAFAAEARLKLQVEIVFAYWALKYGHPGAVLDRKRAARIAARLTKDRCTVSELLHALDGGLTDTWIMGRDPRATRKYDGTETIFRDREQVERLMGLAKPKGVHPMATKYPAICIVEEGE